MWDVFEKRDISKTLKKVPVSVIKNYEAWKRIVEIQGPQGLRLIKGFHDESLMGKWKGMRSSRLNKKWRVIYKINKDYLEIYVLEIMPHNY